VIRVIGRARPRPNDLPNPRAVRTDMTPFLTNATGRSVPGSVLKGACWLSQNQDHFRTGRGSCRHYASHQTHLKQFRKSAFLPENVIRKD
jgi:hypothetical protein